MSDNVSLKMIWRQRRSNKLNFAVSKRKPEKILPCFEIRNLEFYYTSSAIYQLSNYGSFFFVFFFSEGHKLEARFLV